MRFIGMLSLALSALLAVSAAVLLLGCGVNPSSNPTPSTSKLSTATEKIKDAVNATTEAAKAEWDKYSPEMYKRLEEFDAKCKKLEVSITKAEGQAKKDLEKKLEEAKAKRDTAARKLEELKEAGADRWEKVKEGVGKALDDLKKVFD